MSQEEAGQTYRSAVCAVNNIGYEMDDASDDMDMGRVRDLAGDSAVASADAAETLRDASWPDVIDPDDIEAVASYYEDQAESMTAISEAQTMADMMVIRPSASDFQPAVKRIREALDLPSTLSDDCRNLK
ncbi:hypothetical protein GCM10010910_01580 [Microbacterium nanhaiense]|uniref:Uncharacterized protein n=2 Tax=Microbacterium nanhaiense TaxID=1301026 RepID=A0ABQ2MWP7_9MICO|nr:hypothetical protein GCM10010910_01580 [Microbacterium nanhaiense]